MTVYKKELINLKCDICGKEEAFPFPLGEAVKAANKKGWIINTERQLCSKHCLSTLEKTRSNLVVDNMTAMFDSCINMVDSMDKEDVREFLKEVRDSYKYKAAGMSAKVIVNRLNSSMLAIAYCKAVGKPYKRANGKLIPAGEILAGIPELEEILTEFHNSAKEEVKCQD